MNITNTYKALTNYMYEIRFGLQTQSSFLVLIVFTLSTAASLFILLLLSFPASS